MNVIKRFIYYFIEKLLNIHREVAILKVVNKYKLNNVHLSVGQIEGNIKIGEFTYINSGYRIVTGESSFIQIGNYCAIGRNFMCSSRTHDKVRPTADPNHKNHKRKEADIIIGNYVWIGDNVVIREGVIVGNYAIIGANSVVTKNIGEFEVFGGVPAKLISINKSHYCYNK